MLGNRAPRTKHILHDASAITGIAEASAFSRDSVVTLIIRPKACGFILPPLRFLLFCARSACPLHKRSAVRSRRQALRQPEHRADSAHTDTAEKRDCHRDSSQRPAETFVIMYQNRRPAQDQNSPAFRQHRHVWYLEVQNRSINLLYHRHDPLLRQKVLSSV